MNESRMAHAKRNIVFGAINKIVVLVFPFIIRTIVIWKLDAEYLGLNSLFTSILQVFNMAELGFSSAIIYKMYKPIAENDESKVSALLALYKKVYHTIGIAIMSIGLALMPFLKYLIKGTCPNDVNIHILYLIFLSGTIISYLGVAYKSSLLSVAQRQDIISNVDTALMICKSVIQIVLLLVLKNYYAYIIWNPVFVLVNNIVVAFISKKMYPKYVCKGNLEKSEIREILTQIKGIVIGKFALVSRNSFDTITLSMFSGLVQVAIYSNYYYIYTAVLSFISVLVTAITAGIGNVIATETKEKNYEDFKKFNFYFAWIGAWCTVCLFCLYQPFMKLWVGNELMASFSTMILFCIYFYISQMGQLRAIYTSAAGIWWEFRYFQIGEAIGNLVLNFSLGYFFGMNGILLATIITVFVFSIVGIGKKTLNVYFEQSSRGYFHLLAIYAVITAVVCMITNIVCFVVPDKGWMMLVIKGIICVIIPNICFLVIALLNKKHREYLEDAKKIIAR